MGYTPLVVQAEARVIAPWTGACLADRSGAVPRPARRYRREAIASLKNFGRREFTRSRISDANTE
jgi:hypothetical protein